MNCLTTVATCTFSQAFRLFYFLYFVSKSAIGASWISVTVITVDFIFWVIFIYYIFYMFSILFVFWYKYILIIFIYQCYIICFIVICSILICVFSCTVFGLLVGVPLTVGSFMLLFWWGQVWVWRCGPPCWLPCYLSPARRDWSTLPGKKRRLQQEVLFDSAAHSAVPDQLTDFGSWCDVVIVDWVLEPHFVFSILSWIISLYSSSIALRDFSYPPYVA